MKVKTSQLIGPALDWAVAKASGVRTYISRYEHTMTGVCILDADLVDMDTDGQQELKYSRDWSQGGPILERESIGVLMVGIRVRQWRADCGSACHGPTPLVAAMRAYVVKKWGHEVYVPDELMET